ncbi:nicotinate phosphoribosyltransferase [Desulfobaculum bizertense]|uniref:Nicotinate phosphoribosyltransferase n=1 Tax=Desulfobaculum bizertense DSM 18034 TaxID=1121442 RepID=A0A1T4VIV0_9BACT|nr:nicotinate phosphoribosyltransferase [Desulfobaculum bizertense]SKA64835.1 nicotinate phosphoribosyltransferase [Desulfobaculum bizertense DSM 18034]
MSYRLPESHIPYTDAYFLHSRKILHKEGLNPHVTMQVFLRKGPGKIYGIEEAVELIRTFSANNAKNLKVHALPEGSDYAPLETLMTIEGPICDFVELETLYLGAITAATSVKNGGPEPDLASITARAREIRDELPDKTLLYFGSRHWHWSWDERISKAAIAGGFDACATDAGAHANNLTGGVGTIPHALVLSLGHHYGRDTGTVRAAEAFDRHISSSIPRIALVDTFNHECDDAIATARALGKNLWGVRLDTPGENLGQCGAPDDGRRYWTGNGVTVELVHGLRQRLDAEGFEHVNIVLSSGFGNLDKIRAFKEGEAKYGRLFESIGIGSLFPAHFATADIVRVDGEDFAKAGRFLRPNSRLVRVI